MGLPTVTVFIPCYNAERFIAEAIDSILNQTYQDFEILIIDDGSTDKSRDILDYYLQKDDRIRVLYNQCNRGVGYTRNRGVKEAKGKYLATMDADDIAVSTRLEKEVDYLERNKAVGAVGGCAYFIDERGRKIGSMKKQTLNAREVNAHMFFENVIINSASMYRLNLVKRHKIKYKDDFHGVEDYMFWCMLLKYTKIVVLDEYFIFYRKVYNGLTGTNSRKYKSERIRCNNEVHKYMLVSNEIHINTILLNYCLPKYALSFFTIHGYSNIIIALFLMQILARARTMRKVYYPELRIYIINKYKIAIRDGFKNH